MSSTVTAPPHDARRTAIAWTVAIAALIAGPLALSLTFASGEGDSATTAGTLAFVLSSLLLAAVWTTGGLAICALVHHRTAPMSPPMAGSRAVATAMILGVVFALACLVGGLVLHAIPATRPWVDIALDTAESAPALLVLAIALIAGAAEEAFFRLALPRITRGSARWIIPTVLYALATLATGSIGLVLVAIPLGLVAMAALERTGRPWAPLLVHALWSLAMVGLFPLLVR